MLIIKNSVPEVNYRGFRLKRINEPQYKHLWWLLFFPLYWLRYPVIENLNPAKEYHPIYSPLDDAIPFCEWFIIPYMKFLTVSMTISTLIFLIYPSCQNLRPTEFSRDNFFTDCVALLYSIDTNTNVFPSEHAIGSVAVWLSALHTKGLDLPEKTVFITIFMLLICFSTVFLKQHSILDVVAAVPVCLIAFLFCKKRIN